MDNLVWADDNYTVYCFAWTSPLGAPKGCAQCLLLLWKLATTSVSCFDKWRTAWMEGVTNHWHRYTLGTFFPTHGGQIKIHSAFQGPCIYSDSETGIHPEYGEFDLGFPNLIFALENMAVAEKYWSWIDQSGGLFGTWYLSFECTASMKGDILQHRYDTTSEPSFEMDPCACKLWRMSAIRNFDQISECNFHEFRINRLSDLRDRLSRISGSSKGANCLMTKYGIFCPSEHGGLSTHSGRWIGELELSLADPEGGVFHDFFLSHSKG